MFIKKTLKTDSKSGKTYAAYHLVESVRTVKGPRQQTLLYMGAELPLLEGEQKLLAQRIEEIIADEQPLFPYTENVEQLAQTYASQLIRRLSTPKDGDKRSEDENLAPEFVSIDVSSIEKSEPRSIGAEHLMLKMADQLHLPQQLQKLGFSKTDASVALGSIIARAVFPKSERSTYDWLCKRSGLGELLNFDFKKSSLDKLYQISDKLLAHKDTLEEHFEAIECELHGYKNTIALYDLTNTYMEGQAKSNPKAAHGVSKEKRSDCPLVTMGLVMNEYGFLNRTSILPGNASEPQTLEKMIESLSAHQNLFKPTIILDAGIATKDNLAWLRGKGYTYVVSARQDAPSIDLEGELAPVGDLNDFVKAALVKSEDDCEEKWLYCESKAKEAVASEMKQSFKKRFEDDLKKLSQGLSKPKGRKKYIKVIERIGRLKEKHKKISGCYEVNAVASADGATAIAIDWKVLDEKMSDKLTGSYFLRTNLVTMSPKELWQLYNTLRGVEDAFRFMKSSLGLRPVYHQKEHRVDGHLWITIMAYHLIQNCLYQLNKQNINYQWATIRDIMTSRVRVTMQAKMEDGKTLYHRSTTKSEGEQKGIYRALGISPQILKAHKTIF
ncbi:MAG TPA: IS1634 family transposase [Fusibacter sp.]|nr:IS1634 family transposase [Fusibacter sp.]